MELYFLNEDFSLLDGPIESFTSVVWYERFFEAGTFTMYFPRSMLSRVMQAKYVCTSAAEGELKCGRVEYISADDQGECQMGGHLLENLLSDKLITGNGVYSGTVTEAVISAVTSCLGETGITVGECAQIAQTVNLPYNWSTLSEWIYSVLKPYGASYTVTLDKKTGLPVFRIVKGVDRTADGSRVVFSASFGNIAEITMDIDRGTAKNFAYIRGKDETVVTVDKSSGGLKREIFVNADDIAPGKFATNDEYIDALKNRGEEKLLKCPEGFSVSAECVPGTLPQYGKDYFMGDICDVADEELGISYGLRLTAVDTVWENGVSSVFPLFGEEIRYISRMMDKI